MKKKRQIKNFHLVMNGKVIRLLKRIALRRKISVSKLVREIFALMHSQYLNKEFADSPHLSRRKIKIPHKQEIRVYIYAEDYDFFNELAYILRYPSIAQVLRSLIDDYLRGISFDGNAEFARKLTESQRHYERKMNIIVRNHSIIHKNGRRSEMIRLQFTLDESNVVCDLIYV